MSARELGRRVALVALLVAAPQVAAAERLDATATTVLTGRPDPRSGDVHTVVTALQLLQLEARDLKGPMAQPLSITFSGWGGGELGEPAQGQRAVGDIDLLYVRGVILDRLDVRVGRQLVTGGTARVLQLDGARVEGRIWRGLGASLYGGVPVLPELEWHRGDTVIGGRAYYRHSLGLELGASAQRRQERSRMAGEDLGFDQRYRAFEGLWLTGFEVVSLAERRLAEADLRATYQPGERVELALGYRRTAPDLFLSRNSVLAVFATTVRDEVGGGAFLRAASCLDLDAEAFLTDSGTGAGHHLALRADLFPAARRDRGRLGLEARRIAGGGDGTTFVRGFGRMGLAPSLQASASAEFAHADEPRNGVHNAMTGLLAVGWDFLPSWQLGVSALAGVTPALDQRYEAMAKLTYQRTRRYMQVRP